MKEIISITIGIIVLYLIMWLLGFNFSQGMSVGIFTTVGFLVGAIIVEFIMKK